jgi:hypothetical protein
MVETAKIQIAKQVEATLTSALDRREQRVLTRLMRKVTRAIQDRGRPGPGVEEVLPAPPDPKPWRDGYISRETIRRKQAREEDEGLNDMQRRAKAYVPLAGMPMHLVLLEWNYKPDGTPFDPPLSGQEINARIARELFGVGGARADGPDTS